MLSNRADRCGIKVEQPVLTLRSARISISSKGLRRDGRASQSSDLEVQALSGSCRCRIRRCAKRSAGRRDDPVATPATSQSWQLQPERHRGDDDVTSSDRPRRTLSKASNATGIASVTGRILFDSGPNDAQRRRIGNCTADVRISLPCSAFAFTSRDQQGAPSDLTSARRRLAIGCAQACARIV